MSFSRKNAFLALALSLVSPLFLQDSSAGVLDVDTFGLSIHLGGSYNQAPLRLDSNGVYVFNPGIGFGYDFRESAVTSGFSPIIKAGFFEDCNVIPLYYATAGIRYTYFFSENYSIGASVSVGLMNGQNWATQTRSFSFMPLPILEIGRRIYNKDVLKLGTVFAPNNSAMSATSGGGLLFIMLSYAHSF